MSQRGRLAALASSSAVLLVLALGPSLAAQSSGPQASAAMASAQPAPSSTPGPAPAAAGKLTGTRVSCAEGLDCAIAGIVLPPAERTGSLTLLVRNDGPTSANPVVGRLEAIGERTGTILSQTELSPDHDWKSVEPGAVSGLTFSVPRGLVPDHYVGQLAVTFEGVDQPVSADIDVTIREGPAIPMIELAVGAVFGVLIRLARRSAIPRGDLAARLRAVADRIEESGLPSVDRRAAESWLAVSEQAFADGHLTEVEGSLLRIESGLERFALFAGLAVRLGTRTDPGAMKARELIDSARAALANSAADDDALAAASTAYQQARLAALQDAPSAAATTTVLEAPEIGPGPAPVSPRGTAKALARDRIPATRLTWWIREAGAVRVVLGALAYASGVLALYVAPTAGFIGGGFADAAALLLWGLGSSWADKIIFDWG